MNNSSKGKYETALSRLIPVSPKEWNRGHQELLAAAGTIDRLTDQLIRDSKSMARAFEVYAADMSARGEGWSPMEEEAVGGSSTLRDIELAAAKLEVHKEYLSNLLRLVLGTTGALDFSDALNA